MSDAPERIYAYGQSHPQWGVQFKCQPMAMQPMPAFPMTEYVRADRIEELEGKITQAVAALNKAVYLLDPTEEEMTGKGAVYRIMVALAALKGEDRG